MKTLKITNFKNGVQAKFGKRITILRDEKLTQENGMPTYGVYFKRVYVKNEGEKLQESESIFYKDRKHSKYAVKITRIGLTAEAMEALHAIIPIATNEY